MKTMILVILTMIFLGTPTQAATRLDLRGYGSLGLGHYSAGGASFRLGTSINVSQNNAIAVTLSDISDFNFSSGSNIRILNTDRPTRTDIDFDISDIVLIGGRLIADYSEPGTRFHPDGFFLDTGFRDWVGFPVPRVRLEIRDYRYSFFDESGQSFGGGGFFAVPEPSSWLMMIVGFGLLGALLRLTPVNSRRFRRALL